MRKDDSDSIDRYDEEMKGSITEPKVIKQVILKNIRSTLLDLGNATKGELSQKLNLSFPTISKFLSQMEKEGEILVVGLDDSSGGRRAKRYIYNPEYMFGLAIFLEKKETVYTVFNCMGEVKELGREPALLSKDSMLALIDCITSIMADYPKISSLAIGIPGVVDNGRIIYLPEYEQFQDLDLKKVCEDHFSIPVVVENDMNAAVLGYHDNQGVEDKQSLVYLYSGQNGPGAGIIVNGAIVRGRTFFSGEISFVPQYNNRNFGEAIKSESKENITIREENQIDAVSRLVASFVAILNPDIMIFCKDEVEEGVLEKIAIESSCYVPSQHLPKFTTSDWKQDYVHGLQRLALDLMLDKTGN